MYVLKEGRSDFLNFLRNLGAQVMLLTAWAVALFSLEQREYAGDIYVVASITILTLIVFCIAVFANVLEFRAHAFSEKRMSEPRTVRFLLDSLFTILMMVSSYLAILVVVGAALTSFKI
jgi:small-conductance mechanosensitive channel